MVVAAPALGAIAAFAAMCFIVFLYYAYGYTLGALLLSLANFFKNIGVSLGWFGRISLGFIGDGILAVDNAIRDGLWAGYAATRSAGLYCWHYVAYAFTEIGESIAGLAEATERALIRTATVTIPAFITQRLAWLVAHVTALERELAHVAGSIPRAVTHEIIRVKKVVVHEAAAAGAAIPIPRIGRLEREASGLEKWVKAHANLLTISGVVGLIGATIFRSFDLGWLRCKGVGRVGKALCGASGLIETLFADAIDALIVTNLCQWIRAIGYAAKQFQPELIAFVDVEDALINCHGATKPEALNVGALSLPPVTGYVVA